MTEPPLPERVPIKSLSLEDAPAHRSELYGAVAMCGILVLTASIAEFAGQREGPGFKVFLAMAATIWALADLLTAALLLAQFYVTGSIRFGILAVAYAFVGFLTWPYIAAFPGMFGRTAPTIAYQQISITLSTIWHLAFPVVVALSAIGDATIGRIISRAKIRVATIAFAALPLVAAVGLSAAIFAHYDALQQLVHYGHYQPLYKAVFMPAVVTLCVLACIALLVTRGRRTALTAWLVVAIFSEALDAALNMSATRYSYAWDTGRIMAVFTASVVLIMILCDIGRLYGRLARVARVDVLTSLPNRRAFEDLFHLVFHNARRTIGSVAVLLVDIDNFKTYNDSFGHLAGDECLRRVAAEMNRCASRPLDMVARYGGEEFVVVLPGTQIAGVLTVAELIRTSIAALALDYRGRETKGVTVSIGIAFASVIRDVEDSALLEAADRALYVAKDSGRNRSVLSVVERGGISVNYALAEYGARSPR